MPATRRSTIERASGRGASPDATAIIRRGLRSPRDPFQGSIGIDALALVAAASHHRVLLLLGSLLRTAGALDGWPPEFIEAFLAAEREAVAVDCVRQVELT